MGAGETAGVVVREVGDGAGVDGLRTSRRSPEVHWNLALGRR